MMTRWLSFAFVASIPPATCANQASPKTAQMSWNGRRSLIKHQVSLERKAVVACSRSQTN
jgi:hypothetical protein